MGKKFFCFIVTLLLFISAIANNSRADKQSPNIIPLIQQLLLKGSGPTPSTRYHHYLHFDGTNIERRFYYDNHHFMSIIDAEGIGTFAIRFHPGTDVNGWGSTLYLQPFLPGATLAFTTINTIETSDEALKVEAQGKVSLGHLSNYGTWNSALIFAYDPKEKIVRANGHYEINLNGLLENYGDLNLYKIASNYLQNVPLLSGGIGDTGDMEYAEVTGVNRDFSFIWYPDNQPSHYPQDFASTLAIDVKGQYNEIDTSSQGYKRIEPAYKPSIKVTLIADNPNNRMIFGGTYNTFESQNFWSDNVGITPLILRHSVLSDYGFQIYIKSEALPGG